jgi:TolB-like protein
LRTKLIHVLLTGLILFVSSGGYANAAKQVAIVPFKVNAEKDMNFLRDGIYDMLASRLYKEGETEVMPRSRVEKGLGAQGSAVTESNARDLGRQLGADFILFGSLTVLGNSISVDSKMVDVTGTKPSMSFFEQSEDAGGIVTRVNQMAAEISDKMFGRGALAKAPAAAAGQTTQPKPADTHLHPEKLLKQQGGMGSEGPSSPFVTDESAGGRELSPQFWRSAGMKHLFNGIALGDVDGDGKIETVILTPNTLLIYRKEQERFYQVLEYAEDGQAGYNVAVDVADINGNGIPEIFVTRLTLTRKGVNSFVLEHDGKSYRRIVENAPWYFRVADLPDRGRILLGQESRSGSPHSTRIFEMLWRSGRYEPEIPIPVPIALNVLGLTMADVTDARKESIVAFDREDRIRLFDPAGKEEWKSAEKFGGSTLSFAGERTLEGEIENPIYLPMRLIPLKSGSDGKAKIIAIKNLDVAGMHLEKFRSFSESQIMSFFWDGLGLAPEWRTRKFTGNIRDFAIGDFDNDGVDELVAALILEEGRVITTTPKCTVIALEFK